MVGLFLFTVGVDTSTLGVISLYCWCLVSCGVVH